MSSLHETENGLLWVIRDDIIPSNTVSLCEEAVRRKMYSFIKHEVRLTSFAKPGPLFHGDLDWCKEEMEDITRGMDLMRIPMLFKNSDGEIMQIDLEMVSNCENIDELTSQMKKNQHVPGDESCEIQERLHVSTRSTSELEECSFIFKTEILDLIQNQNASYMQLYLPLDDEICTELNHRLIEATTCYFTDFQRGFMESRRRDHWKYRRMFREDTDIGKEMDWNSAANKKAEYACKRDKFLTRAGLQPPQVLRVIDIEATCRQRECVVLIDYQADRIVQHVGYTAISHTYGMDIYEVFDCPCASDCTANVIRPRCNSNIEVCPSSEKHKRAVNDILRMCDILSKAGVNYAWHDGVCIAQYDTNEVDETIKHMGWIYANAKETVIFLHTVGNPIAPLRISNHDVHDLCSRWDSRAWTFQEAVLSKCRRYCMRVGPLMGHCQSGEEFEEKLSLWYKDDSSTIEIMEEERFFQFVKEIHTVICSLCVNVTEKFLSIPVNADDDVILESNWMWVKAYVWFECTRSLLTSMVWSCFEFPTKEKVLGICGSRKSKHRGDKMNSILALAEVKDFVAHKDDNVEASTIDFFKRIKGECGGELGLAMAVFSINNSFPSKYKEYITDERQHTWPPILWDSLIVADFPRGYELGNIGYKVLENGRMELRGELRSVKVRFTLMNAHKNCGENYTYEDCTEDDQQLVLPNDASCVDMALTESEPDSFKASLSECVTGRVYISAIERCSSQTLVLAWEFVEDGDSFDAHLLITPHRDWLIVQGRMDIAADQCYVSKVGLFQPTHTFFQAIPHLNPNYLDKIIII